jgi:hypothetical protein
MRMIQLGNSGLGALGIKFDGSVLHEDFHIAKEKARMVTEAALNERRDDALETGRWHLS